MDDLQLGRYIERLDRLAQQLLEDRDLAERRHADNERRFELAEKRIKMMEDVHQRWAARLDGGKWTLKGIAFFGVLVLVLVANGIAGAIKWLLERISG